MFLIIIEFIIVLYSVVLLQGEVFALRHPEWGPSMGPDATAKILEEAGFPKPIIRVAVCLAEHESSFRPRTENINSNATVDYGLMQVNTVWLKSCKTTPEGLKNPLINAQCALIVFRSQGLTAWVTFNKYKDKCLKYRVNKYNDEDLKEYHHIIESHEEL